MHKLGIIGYGGMGGWHVEFAQKSDVVSLAGVYDIDPKRNDAARENGIRAYESMEEMLGDESIDIITVAIPNDSHKDVVIKCLEAGKNVICEKPVALSSAELGEMVQASHRCGRLFTVHQNRRWDEDFLAIKKIYDSGEIGEVFNIESRVHGSRGIPGDWRGKKEHGGGMLLDWGVHLIDQMLQIYKQKIVKLYCRFEHTTNFEVDDGFKLELVFDGGAQAHIEVGTYNFISMPRFYVQAKDGSAIISDWGQNCKIVARKVAKEGAVTPVKTAAGLTKTMAPRNEVTTSTYECALPCSDVHDFYRNFCAAIEGREQQLIKHDEVMRVMRVMETAFESVEKDAVITCEL